LPQTMINKAINNLC